MKLSKVQVNVVTRKPSLYQRQWYPSSSLSYATSSSNNSNSNARFIGGISKTNDLRKSFLDYFSSKECRHLVHPSAPLIPNSSDQSLLFTSAGMVPFKQCFLGNENPKSKRMTTVQRCLRVGGKHNDLDEVGFTNRHQTLFEMLGNFSFGDYFKEEAILFAWNYLTKVLQIPKERLCITVFNDDLESERIWKKITGFKTVDDENIKQNEMRAGHIVRMGHQDNFWSMGDEPDSPCGPCTEIYFDRGDDEKYKQERFLEIWNLVFMQYKNGKKKGELLPLPNPCVDTGMGLERLASVMQGVDSNFDIDSMQVLVNTAKQLSNGGKDIAALRVIADHSRAAAFLVADGVVPSNIGRGYVLRRIIRRAAGFGHQIGITQPFLSKMLPVIESSFPSDVYPELRERRDIIASVVSGEEEIFSRTLERGMKMLNKKIDEASHSKNKALKPSDAFQLYDTFGFPLDFVQRIIKVHGITLDLAKVDKLMDEQRGRSGASDAPNSSKPSSKSSSVSSVTTGSAVVPDSTVLHWAKENIYPKFVGYDKLVVENSSILVASPVKSKSDEMWIAIDPCPFYPQGGGQVGDIGEIEVAIQSESELNKIKKYEVIDCVRPYGDTAIIRVKGEHIKELKPQLKVKAIVNAENRNRCSAHHTATHLLHAALRERFGKTVGQAGSLVTNNQFRFDFTHPRALTQEDIEEVEKFMNDHAKRGSLINISEMSLSDAKEIGAIMMFNEKYNPEKVRVVKIDGDKKDDNDKSKAVSIELCGGTHVPNTKHCYPIKILNETSVAAGTRRIEAVAGDVALEWFQSIDKTMGKVMKLIGLSESSASNSDLVLKKLDVIKNQPKQMLKDIEKLEKAIASTKVDPIAIVNEFKMGDGKIVKKILIHKSDVDQELSDEIKRNCLRQRGEYLRKEYPDAVHVVQQDKDIICIVETKSAQNANAHAGNILKLLLSNADGKGGGSNFMATYRLKEYKSIESIINHKNN